MAPAYIANMSAPLIKYWRGWNRPISRRWLGSHKTVMGFATGLLGALATAFVQHVIGYETDGSRGAAGL
jgi:CDP-2,3-bis-(O-geranylgeranyl)-sn-glycerol synthase